MWWGVWRRWLGGRRNRLVETLEKVDEGRGGGGVSGG